MPDANKIISRLTDPGTIIILVGAVAVYASGAIARRFHQDEDKQSKLNIGIKAVGCVLTLAGMLVLFDFFG